MRTLLIFICMVHLSGCTFAAREPLSYASLRPQLLTFGLFVTPDPDKNPIDPPERFTGFHTGLDYEIFDGELHTDVPVFAICSGEILVRKIVEGYGGVIVEKCMFDDQEVTVIYGHLKNDNAVHNGAFVEVGQKIALLGDDKSAETDGNRKHLHLGIHKGPMVEYAGYVQSEADLREWIDPAIFLERASNLPGQK